MALPKSTVISFWKPEVSVKLVSDFQRYPYGHRKFPLLLPSPLIHAAFEAVLIVCPGWTCWLFSAVSSAQERAADGQVQAAVQACPVCR